MTMFHDGQQQQSSVVQRQKKENGIQCPRICSQAEHEHETERGVPDIRETRTQRALLAECYCRVDCFSTAGPAFTMTR